MLNRAADPTTPDGRAASGSISARTSARCNASVPIENSLRRHRLVEQHRPGRDVIVPFDQRRPCPRARYEADVEVPNRGVNRTIMRIDEKRPGGIVGGKPGMAGEVNFTDMLGGEAGDIARRIEAVIGGGDIDVVDVEQEAATGAPGELFKKVDLRHLILCETKISRGVLDKDSSVECLLHLIDVGGNERQRLGRVGQRQQIVEIGRLVRGPGKMLGEQARLIAPDQRGKPAEMLAIKRLRTADREADSVERQRVVAPYAAQHVMWRPAGTHIVLRVHLEPADVGPVSENGVIVLMFQPDAGAKRDRRGDHRSAYDLAGASEPVRVEPSGSFTVIFSQVPLATNFQAFWS